MRIASKISLLTAGTLLSSISAATIAVAAPNSHANAQAANSTSTASSTRLEAAKLRACQNREKAINNILRRIAARGQRQVDLFSTIATRVEKFYDNKGKTLNNYTDLVSDVNSKKTAAQDAVNKIKSDSVSFKCDG